MSTPMKAEVDLGACKGHGRCFMTAPEIFDCDDDGFPLVIGEASTPKQQADLTRVINNCPEQAVSAASAR